MNSDDISYSFLIAVNMLASLILAILLAIKLKKKRALNYFLSTALLMSLLIGALLGVCLRLTPKSNDVLENIMWYGALPFWIIVGIESQTLLNRSILINPREVIFGTALGIVMNIIINIVLFFIFAFVFASDYYW